MLADKKKKWANVHVLVNNCSQPKSTVLDSAVTGNRASGLAKHLCATAPHGKKGLLLSLEKVTA